MLAFGITVKDLSSTKAISKAKGKGKPAKTVRATKADAGAKKAAKPVEAKFRGPNGESWSGRGLAPKWLKALIAEGKTKEEFAIRAAKGSLREISKGRSVAPFSFRGRFCRGNSQLNGEAIPTP